MSFSVWFWGRATVSIESRACVKDASIKRSSFDHFTGSSPVLVLQDCWGGHAVYCKRNSKLFHVHMKLEKSSALFINEILAFYTFLFFLIATSRIHTILHKRAVCVTLLYYKELTLLTLLYSFQKVHTLCTYTTYGYGFILFSVLTNKGWYNCTFPKLFYPFCSLLSSSAIGVCKSTTL